MMAIESWLVGLGVLVTAVLVSTVRASWLALLLASPLLLLFAVYALDLALSWNSKHADREAVKLRRLGQAFRPLAFTTPSAWSAGLTRLSWEESTPTSPSSIHPKAPHSLRERLDNLLQLVRRDFILPWYNRLSPSPAFPNAVDRTIRQTLSSLVNRAEDVDWASLVTSKTIPLITELIDHYKRVEVTLPKALNADIPIPLPPEHHPAVTPSNTPSLAPAAIEAHLHQVVDRLLDNALPQKDRASLALRIMTREIIANMILMPVIDMLSDGDFWNRLIEERGRRQLHEEKLVKKVLSALDSTRPPKTPRTPVKRRAVTTIAMTSTPAELKGFIQSLRLVKDLNKAKQYRADIEREIRKAVALEGDKSLMSPVETVNVRDYINKLSKAQRVVEGRIEQLAGLGTFDTSDSLHNLRDVTLDLILANQASTVPWLEHMERRGKTATLQFWLLVESLKDPLEALETPEEGDEDWEAESTARSVNSSGSEVLLNLPGINDAAHEDIKSLWYSYFDKHLVNVPERYREATRKYALDGAKDNVNSLAKARRAVFLSQRYVFQQMVDQDWDDFRRTELYRKALAELDSSQESYAELSLRKDSASLPKSPLAVVNPFKQLLSPERRERPLLQGPHLSFFNKLAKSAGPVSASSTKPSLSPTKASFSDITKVREGMPRRILNRGQTWSPTPTDSAHGHLSESLGSLISSPEPEDRAPLFADDDAEADIDTEARLRISKRQQDDLTAALSTIIAGDGDMSMDDPSRHDTLSGTHFASPAASLVLPDRAQVATQPVSVGRHPTHARSSESLKSSPSEPRGQPSGSLQNNSSSLAVPRPEVVSDDEDSSAAQAALSFGVSNSHVDQPLHVAIERLQEQETLHLDHIQQLESYVDLAELHASDEMLQLCRQSMHRVRRDLAAVQLRITNYTQQQLESRLIPGRTSAAIARVAPVDGVYWFDVVIIRDAVADQAEQTWTVTKRFSQFNDLRKTLHDWIDNQSLSARTTLRQKSKQTPEFPAKSVITKSNLLQEHRRHALERYIQSLISVPEFCTSPPLHDFLERTPTDLSMSLALLQRSLDSVAGGEGLPEENSFQRLLTAVGSIGGQFVEDLAVGPTIMIHSVQTAITSQAADMTRGFGDMVNTPAMPSFVQPLQDLCMALLDYDASAWTLRRPAVLGTLQAIAGTIEKQVRAAPAKLFSFEAVERYIASLQSSLWPDGQRRPPSILRTEQEKQSSRSNAEMLLFPIIPDAVVAFCGKKYILKGVRRSLALLQDHRLNQHLVLTTLDDILDALYPATTPKDAA